MFLLMWFIFFYWIIFIFLCFFFFFNDTATTEIYTLSLHDALPISRFDASPCARDWRLRGGRRGGLARVFCFDAFSYANRYSTPDRVRGKLSLENAILRKHQPAGLDEPHHAGEANEDQAEIRQRQVENVDHEG